MMSSTSSNLRRSGPEPSPDQFIFLHDISWEQFEQLLEMKGDQAGVLIAYLEGVLQLMSPSINHEILKTMIARLVEAYAEERDLNLNGYGSWTIRKRLKKRGVEPDECYVLDREPGDAPDLAIEVVWTSGGLDKLKIYRGLGVGEVWMWIKGRIEVFVLRDEGYERVEGSDLLPGLDLDLLTSFLDRPNQTRAVKAFRAALRESEIGPSS